MPMLPTAPSGSGPGGVVVGEGEPADEDGGAALGDGSTTGLDDGETEPPAGGSAVSAGPDSGTVMPLPGVVEPPGCETGGAAMAACPATGPVQAAIRPAPTTSARNRYDDLISRS
jgi:hypothetical protein